MDIDWGAYQRLPPELLMKPRDVTREEAWRRHRLRMKLLPERLEAVERLARANGIPVGERGHRNCEAVEVWVRDVVLEICAVDDVRARHQALYDELATMSPEQMAARFPDGARSFGKALGSRSGHEYIRDDPAPARSLVHDAAMLCGDELIARHPTVSWQLQRGSPRNIVYHHTVQVGRANPRYSAEPVFSYLQALGGELLGDEHRRRWPVILEQAEQWV